MAEAEELCDRVALVRAGRVVAQGSIEQLRQALHYGVRRELRLQHMPPELPDALRRLPGIISLEVAHEDGLHVLDIAMGGEGALLAALLRETVESGAEVYDCATRQVSLEEIYLRTLSGDPAAPMPSEVTLC
jgi:ABC-2 type transport system ATP-binding protein